MNNIYNYIQNIESSNFLHGSPVTFNIITTCPLKNSDV